MLASRMKKFLSGSLIALGAFAYLNTGGLAGAVLFAFGIISIVKLQIPLYTGVAGTEIAFREKADVLVWNIAGTLLASLLLLIVSKEAVIENARQILAAKAADGWLSVFVKAVMCGVIVDISVFLSKKENNVLPLIFGIPLFILCGFNHSIADVTYIVLGWHAGVSVFRVALYYLICVAGNYLGCNFRRFCIR